MQKVQNFDNMDSPSPGFSNRIYPDDDKSMKLVKDSSFQITQKTLIEIVSASENRKICEEVDKIEQMGGFQHFHPLKKPFSRRFCDPIRCLQFIYLRNFSEAGLPASKRRGIRSQP